MVTHISIHHRRGLFNFLVGVNVSKARPRRKTLLFAVFAIQTRVRARRAAAELNEASTTAPTSKPDVSSGNTRVVFSCHHMLLASWDEMTKKPANKADLLFPSQLFFSVSTDDSAAQRPPRSRPEMRVGSCGEPHLSAPNEVSHAPVAHGGLPGSSRTFDHLKSSRTSSRQARDSAVPKDSSLTVLFQHTSLQTRQGRAFHGGSLAFNGSNEGGAS